jgi:hypothetical protein
MTCRDFQHRWNELLDAEAAPEGGPSIDEIEAALLAHAAECPACRPIAARYQALRKAIRAWRRPPSPPADLAHHILSTPADLTPGTVRVAARRSRRLWSDHRARYRLIRSGLAAAFLVCTGLGILLTRINRHDPSGRPDRVTPTAADNLRSISGPRGTPGGPSPLDRALSEATSATWDLARSAAEPAARIGREMLDASAPAGDPTVDTTESSAGPDEGLAGLSISVPNLDPLGSDADPASAIIEQVGGPLSAGFKPLSSTARHAFGFLLGPPPARAGSRPDGSTSNGARSG